MHFGKIKNSKTVLTCVVTALAMMVFAGSAFAGTATYSSLQKYKWSSCTVCAGTNGSGPSASYSQTLYIGSPSLTGSASKFSVGGSTPYSNALWWKQVGANSTAHNFKYDLYFYIKNPSAAQALEFDVNQSVGGHKYIFGTQCAMKSSGTWEVYSAAYH